jgi:pyruvate kinase
VQQKPGTGAEAIAAVVEYALETVPCAAVLVPTRSGTTARMVSRFKPAVWAIALSAQVVGMRNRNGWPGRQPPTTNLASAPSAW